MLNKVDKLVNDYVINDLKNPNLAVNDAKKEETMIAIHTG